MPSTYILAEVFYTPLPLRLGSQLTFCAYICQLRLHFMHISQIYYPINQPVAMVTGYKYLYIYGSKEEDTGWKGNNIQ